MTQYNHLAQVQIHRQVGQHSAEECQLAIIILISAFTFSRQSTHLKNKTSVCVSSKYSKILLIKTCCQNVFSKRKRIIWTFPFITLPYCVLTQHRRRIKPATEVTNGITIKGLWWSYSSSEYTFITTAAYLYKPDYTTSEFKVENCYSGLFYWPPWVEALS